MVFHCRPARLALLAASALAVTSLFSAQVVEPGKPRSAPAVPQLAPLTQRQVLQAAPVFKLTTLDDSIRDLPSPRHGVARVGVRRALAASVLSQGAWQSAVDGASAWRLALHSANAVALRVHFVNFNAGAGHVWVHDTANQQTYGPYTGLGRFHDGDFWTEAIFGDTIEIEYVPAAGHAASGAPPFQIPEISHLYRAGGLVAPLTSLSQRGNFASASPAAAYPDALGSTSCFLDAACYTSGSPYPAVPLVAGATAYLLFSDASGEYQCSGTMLNAPNGAPVLLTAGHCINSSTTVKSLTAAFDYRPSACNGPMPNAANLVQITGQSILSYSNLPFETVNTTADIVNDLDYSLVLMSGFPNVPDFTLAGYSTAELAFGQNVTSLSYPIGLSLRFAYAPRVDSTRVDNLSNGLYPGYWANAYQIEFNTNGRIDDGSSGSGIFDDQGHLLASLSTGVPDCNNPNTATGACPVGSTACGVTGAYDNWYNKFGATYEQARDYLELPIPGPLSSNPAVFSASPNPIYTTNPFGLGQTTLTYNAPSTVSATQVHIGSPTGPQLGQGTNTGTMPTGLWVTNGMVFYLQDVTGGKALTAANTLATLTAQVVGSANTQTPAGTLVANPGTVVVPNGSYYGQTTLSWTTTTATLVELHIGSPTGVLFGGGGATGSATTGDWVTDGMTFYLVDVSNGPASAANLIATAVVHVQQDGGATVGPGNVVFFLDPDPILASPGQVVGNAILHWNTGGVNNAQIRVATTNGPLLGSVGSVGISQNLPWVSNGLLFYLEDMNGKVLATATGHLTTSTINLGNTQFTVTNNPISVPPGRAPSATVSWSSSVSSMVEIHENAPWGPAVASGGASGTATIANVTDGMTLYLQDRSGDNAIGASYGVLPLELQYTLATAVVHVVNQ